MKLLESITALCSAGPQNAQLTNRTEPVHVRAIRKVTISQDNRASRSIVDHMRIIDALEKRDTEAAERLVRQHTLDLAAHVEKYCDFLD